MQHRLTPHVAVRFVGEHDEARRPAEALDRGEQPLRVDRKRPRVVVGLSMRHEDRLVDAVRVHEGRHPQVDVPSLPERALLVLEAERGERAVVGTAARDAGAEQVGMGQQVRRHERAVTVTAHPDPIGIGDAGVDHGFHGGAGVHHQLLHIVVVRRVAADDRHFRVVEHGIPLRQEEEVRGPPDDVEAVGRRRHLARRGRGSELRRVGPHHDGEASAGRVAGRKIERARQGHAVFARVCDEALLDARQLRGRILEGRQGAERGAAVVHEVIGWLRA